MSNVSVSKETNRIVIGSGIRFDPAGAVWDEKRRISDEIRSAIARELAAGRSDEVVS